MRSALGLLTFSLFWCGSALATTVVPLSGKVYINRGQGYRSFTSSQELSSGDTLFVRKNSKAQIIYAQDCVQDLEPGTVLTIGTVSPCNGQPVRLSCRGNSLKDGEYGKNEGECVGDDEDRRKKLLDYLVGTATVGGLVVGIVNTSISK